MRVRERFARILAAVESNVMSEKPMAWKEWSEENREGFLDRAREIALLIGDEEDCECFITLIQQGRLP